MNPRVRLAPFLPWSFNRLRYTCLLMLVCVHTTVAQTPTIRSLKAGGTGNGNAWVSWLRHALLGLVLCLLAFATSAQTSRSNTKSSHAYRGNYQRVATGPIQLQHLRNPRRGAVGLG